MTGRRLYKTFSAALAGFAAVYAAQALVAQVIAAEPSCETIRDVVYASRGEQKMLADVYQPVGRGPFPGVLCIHGGAWIFGNKDQVSDICQRLAESGYVAVAIDYRLAPEHKFPAQIDDCRAALEWTRRNARKYKIDPERLGGWGYSAGAHLVALLAVSDSGLKAVVAGGTPCNLQRMPLDSPLLILWLGGTRRKLPEVYKWASPTTLVSPDDPPMFLYHGQTDVIVSIGQATEMVTALRTSGVRSELLAIPNTGHLGAFTNREAMAEAIEFLDEYLKPQRAATTHAVRRSAAP